MEHNQNTIAAINHLRALRIKFHDHSWLLHQPLENMAVVERLILGFKNTLEVAVVEAFHLWCGQQNWNPGAFRARKMISTVSRISERNKKIMTAAM